MHLIGHFPEGRDATGAFALMDGVDALRDHPARMGGLLTGIGKGDGGGVPRPISRALPRQVKRRTHLREPIGETIRYRLPPSLYLPAFAASTFRAVSLPAIAVFLWSPNRSPKLARLKAVNNGEWRTVTLRNSRKR